MDILSLLPPEISDKIVDLLDVNTVLNCGSVCREWYGITSENNRIWKRFCEQKSINEDKWNWHLIDWTLGKPSRWKIYYMNFHKTAYNWKYDLKETYKITGQKINQTSYDGKTLIVYNEGNLEVYRVKNTSIDYRQMLNYKSFNAHQWITNSSYIIVAYIDFMIVYRFNNVYYLDHMICIEGSLSGDCHDVRCITDTDLMDSTADKVMDNIASPILTPYALVCVLSSTLFLHVLDCIYGWSLIGKNRVLKIATSPNTRYVSDDSLLFVSSRNKIRAYNSNGEKYYIFDTDYRICKLLLNDNIIVALGVEYFSNLFKESGATDRMSVWNKNDGKAMLYGRVFYAEDCWLLLTSNVIVVLEYDMIFYLIARRIVDDEPLWKIPLSLQTDGINNDYFNILTFINAGVILIYYCVLNNSQERQLTAYNLHNGELLYSHSQKYIKTHDAIKGDLYIDRDILMYVDKYNDQVVIHLYR